MEPVFIVAQYKSGTSWLLSALSAHPDVLGIREVDIIRAAYEFRGRSTTPASTEHRLERLFGRSAWCRTDPTPFLARGEHPQPEPLEPDRPQGFDDLEPAAALALYKEVAEGTDPRRMLDMFLEAVSTRSDAGHVVLKAADQIWLIDALNEWQPDAKKIAITRDGRDAAISAEHYKRLMAAENAPWLSGSRDYLTLLENWAGRAEVIAARGRAGEVYVMRYEDLSADFAGEFGRVLRWLGLDASAETVAAIDAKTSFEARTGRRRGTSGTGVIRKGAVREWLDVLDAATRNQAWEVAGPQLAALGYTEDGSPAPLPADVAPRAAEEV